MKHLSQAKGKPVHVLLVEDNPDDIDILKEVMEDSKLVINLDVVMDGKEAIDYLRHEKEYVDSQLPDMILLDWNLPKMGGDEVLEEIKSDEELCLIPVIVLTTSESDQDILKAYKNHANCFITKPVDLEQFSKIVNLLDEFWFTIVRLPPRP